MALAEIGARLRLQGAAAYKRDADKAAEATGRLDKATDRAVRGIGSLDRALSSGLRAGLTGVGGAAKLAGAGLGIAAVAATGLSLKFLRLATDAGETESKFKTVFGAAAPEVSKYIANLSDSFGLTTKSLQDATAAFALFGQGAKLPAKEVGRFSTALVQAGLDLGSFYNADAVDVFDAISSGLRGEADPLERYGIMLSEVALNAFAAEKGLKAFSKSNDNEKMLLRQAFIVAKVGKASGDLAKTSGGLANQQRALAGRLEETGTILGKALLPGATRAVSILNGRLAPAMTRLRDLAPSMEKKFSGIVDKVFAFGDAMALAGKLGGARGMVQLLDQMTGSGGKLTQRFDEVGKIMSETIIPTAERMANTLGKALTLVADNTRLAYYALGAYLLRTKILLAYKAGWAIYAGVLALIAKRHAQQAAAATAASAATVAASGAATAAGVRQAVVIGNLRYAYLALGGTAVLGAIGGIAAAFAGVAYWTKRASEDAKSIANLEAGTPTATTRVPQSNNPLTFNGQPVPAGPPAVQVVPPLNVPQLPKQRSRAAQGRQAEPVVNISPAPVTLVIDRKVVGESVVQFVRDTAARR